MSTEFLVSATTTVGIYYLLAAGLNLQYGVAGILNLGVHGCFATGAYAYGLFTQPPGSPTAFAWGLSMPVAAGIAILVSAAVSVLVVLPSVVLDSRTRSPYLAPMLTLASAETLVVVLSAHNHLAGGFAGLFGIRQPLESVFLNRGPDAFAWAYLLLVLLVAALVTALLLALRASSFGLLARAAREDEVEARTLGFTPLRTQVPAVALGGALMGVAGVLWAGYLTTVQPTGFGIFETLLVLIAVTAGGKGNVWGTLAGSVVVFGILNQALRLLPADVLSAVPGVRQIILGVVLILLLRFRPEGLVPDRPRRYRHWVPQRVVGASPGQAVEPVVPR